MLAGLYASLPIFFQDVVCSLVGLTVRRARYGRHFRRSLAQLLESQHWSTQRLRDYQDEQLRRLIDHAYRTIPYYRKVMEERGLKPADIAGKDDLPKLPILTKADVRANVDRMVSSAFDRRRLIKHHTSGTTGTSLEFWTTLEAQQFQWALWWRHRSWLGLNHTDRVATFSGQPVVPQRQSRPPYWRHVWPMNQLYLSVYHMSSQTVSDYARAIEQFRPQYMSGYPSSMFLFATLLEEHGIILSHRPSWVTTGAETMLPWQKEKIERAIAPCSEHYGLAEQCGNLSRCERGIFHEDMEYGIIEPIPVNADDPAGACRLIQTGLTNWAMPFIRYDVGDVATYTRQPCPCGRPGATVQDIDGRIDSFIVLPNGRMLGRLANVFKGALNVVEGQVVQDQVGQMTVRIVPGPEYVDADGQRLVARFRERVGPDMQIDIEKVDRIPRTRTGKIRLVVSSIGPEFLRQRHAGGQAATGQNR